METGDRREGARRDIICILDYICLDSSGCPVKQGVARSLDISENGARIETHEPIETKHIMFLAIGINEDVCDIKGKVAYCIRMGDGQFESGVDFYEISFDAHAKLKQFIQSVETIHRNLRKYI